MTVNVIFAQGVAEVSVPASQKIAIQTDGTARITKLLNFPQYPGATVDLGTVSNQQTVFGTFSSSQAITIRIESTSGANVYYTVGASPVIDQNAGTLNGTVDPLSVLGYASTQGGAVVLTGGSSSTSANAGGAVTVTGGTPGATGVGGAVTVTTGAGGSTSGASGAMTLATGTTTAGSGSATGNVVLKSGAGAASAAAVAGGASGTVTVQSSAGGANTGGATGQVGGAGGAVAITGGAGGATNSAGAHAGGAGANVTVTAGAGGNATAGTGNGGAGGNVALVPGSGGTSAGGTAGGVGVVVARGALAFKQAAPSAETTGVTLTAGELVGGLITGTQSSGANVNYQLPTGTNLDAAFAALGTDEAIEWTLINLSTGANTITVTANTNHTIVGRAIVDVAATGVSGSATFRSRKTATNTFVTYRIS